VAAVFVACAPILLHPALPIGSDIYATIHYIEGFTKALSEGDWYPRWTDRTNQDLGGPSFVIFPPFFYYTAAAGVALAGSIIGGTKLAILIVMLLCGISFHLLARDWVGRGLPAAAATILYLWLPYHILDVYQRFAMSESTAFVFFPLILLFSRRLLDGRGGSDFAGLSLSYAGLAWTHLVSALPFSLFLGVWLLWETKGRLRSLARPLAALACGIGLSAPVVLPAMIETSYINIQWVREAPNADYRNNFIFRDDPIPGLGFKDPVKPPVLKSAHSQLALAGLAAFVALALAGDDARRRRLVIAMAAACGGAYFLQLEISTPVWKIVPQLPTVQFPWRLQAIMVVTAAILAGFALDALRARHASPAPGRGGGPLAPILLGVVVAVNLLLAAQNAFLKPYVFDEPQCTRPGVVDWPDPTLTPIQYVNYREFKMVHLEFPRAAFTKGSGEVLVSEWLSSRRKLRVTGTTGGTVLVRSFWFPGWTGWIDGAPLPLRPAPPYGAVEFDVPPGDHEVEMRLLQTPLRRGAAFTGLAFLALTAGLAWGPFRGPVRTPEAS